MDFSCIDIRELLDSTLSKWFENPGDKSPNLDDLGIQLDCNDTTKDTSKDTKERFVEPSVIPQVYVNEYNEDIDPTWTNMENAKWASKKEADLVGETDQEGDVFMYNYRSDQEEPKKDFFTDEIYLSGIEPRFYMKAEEETSQTSVVNNVVDNVKDSVSENITPQVGGSSGTPRMYGTKPSGDKQMKNYAFELTTIEKIAEEIIVEADLESKKPYLLQQLNKAKITGDEAEKVIQQVNEADPTGNYATYTQWLLGQYLKGNFKLEDKDEAKELLKTFNEETKSKRLKGVNINQSKYQDLKTILEEHLGTKDKASNKLSRELEGTEAQFLTSYTDNETGDKYDLIRVTNPEDAEKLFSGTEWCVRHPGTAQNYLEEGDFFLLRKNGKNYLLRHSKDFRDVEDKTPTETMEDEFNNTMNEYDGPDSIVVKLSLGVGLSDSELDHLLNNYDEMEKVVDEGYGQQLIRRYLQFDKHNIKDTYDKVCVEVFDISHPDAIELLYDGLIDKEYSPQAYNDVVDYLIDIGNGDRLLSEGIVTKSSDPEKYNSIIKVCLEHSSHLRLLTNGVITKEEDPELWSQIVEEYIDNGRPATILDSGILTKDSDEKLFYKAINKLIEKGKSVAIICNEYITKESDPDLYQDIVEKAIENNTFFDLLRTKTLTKENDKELFDRAIKKALDNGWIEDLIHYNLISDEDATAYLNRDLFSTENGESLDESSNDDTTKESSFELTTIDKLADLFGDGVRQDEIPDSENRFLNRSPITEVNKDQKEELMEKAKKVNKPVTYIPKDLNYPFIEDEMAGNKLFYTNTDFLLDDLYQ